ncbi:MAG: hypothetical protein M3R13_07695 [Armatimonadota bacterium]|nr:hypothetical protein [Armatimonadota bacterium]
MALVLGIDGGGTSTKAVILDHERLVWEGSGPASNLVTTSPADTAVLLRNLLAGCPQPDDVCGAFAGLVTTHQANSVEETLRELFPAATVRAVPDFEAALAACEPTANLCVIAGTGSIVCNRHEGSVKRTGGRGYVLGDEGSAFQFGRDALLAFLDGSDEAVSETLASAVEHAFGTRCRSDAIAALYASPGLAGRVASLAPALVTDAANQEIYALKSLRTNMAKLAHVCRQHLKRYGPENPVIGCQGGLWASPVYRRAFVDALPLWCEISPDKVLFDLPAPVFGAAAIARRSHVD